HFKRQKSERATGEITVDRVHSRLSRSYRRVAGHLERNRLFINGWSRQAELLEMNRIHDEGEKGDWNFHSVDDTKRKLLSYQSVGSIFVLQSKNKSARSDSVKHQINKTLSSSQHGRRNSCHRAQLKTEPGVAEAEGGDKTVIASPGPEITELNYRGVRAITILGRLGANCGGTCALYKLYGVTFRFTSAK
ncbi:hypothetical protein EVAR_49474_1, partial [Eumeta japonica]